MTADIYTTGEYLETNPTWHVEDSPWKARQIARIIQKNNVRPARVAELGCGAGVILDELSKLLDSKGTSYCGYDIAPKAIAMARSLGNPALSFFEEDLLADSNTEMFDVLLMIDVFEHVPDYMGFVTKCKAKARYKIYHIPLDLHVSGMVRNSFIKGRYTLGHLHYFTADSALATLKDTGHKIVDYAYTDAAFGLFKQHPSFKRAVANVPRFVLSKFSVPFTSRMLGGYSLLVLAE